MTTIGSAFQSVLPDAPFRFSAYDGSSAGSADADDRPAIA